MSDNSNLVKAALKGFVALGALALSVFSLGTSKRTAQNAKVDFDNHRKLKNNQNKA